MAKSQAHPEARADQDNPQAPADDASTDDISSDGTANDRSDADRSDADLSELNYEQARDELIKVVQQLETGGVPLAESLALWERGERLAAICQQWLNGAKQRVENARTDSDTAEQSA